MHINLITICSTVLLCGFTLLTGCEKQEAPPPAKPVVVRMKIAPVKEETPSVKPETAPGQRGAKQADSSATGAAQPVQPTPPAGKGAVPPETTVAPPVTASVTPEAPATRPRTAPPATGSPVVPPGPVSGSGAPAEVPLTAATPSVEAAGAGVVPVAPPPANGNYDPVGRIDPFAPLFTPTPTKETVGIGPKKKKKRRPLTPLEKLDLSQLKLVGVLRMPKGNKALVEESSGKGYVVTKGMYMGRNSGVVVKILKDRVVIEEEIEGFTGKISIEKRELKMEKPVGEF